MKDPDNSLFDEPGSGTPGSTPPSMLDGARNGDEESRKRLVTLYLPIVYHRYLAKVPRDERSDLVQQVFATVFRKIDRFEKRFDGPAFRGWLHRIAYHKVGDYIRRKRREAGPRAEGGVPGLSPPGGRETEGSGEMGPDSERRMLVRNAFEMVRAEFEVDTYSAAWQVLIEGRPVDEVADDLGKTRNAVYIAKSRVLKRVRDILEELGEQEGQ